jgi:site-specific recombinase XerD
MLQFVNRFNYTEKNLIQLTNKQIIKSCITLIQEKKYSHSSQKQFLGSIKKFYSECFRRDIDLSVIYPSRSPRTLPDILSLNEVKVLLNETKNMKHKAILTTIYGLGLRISELINLKITDIDSDRMIVSIRQAKGKKDRNVMLPDNLLKLLRTYFLEYNPKIYLFEGQNLSRYSASSIRKILIKSIKKTGITKKVKVHTLRHSFATHLLENGTDVRIIQKLLGHNNLNTTMLYTQVANTTISRVKSPLDLL